MFTDPLGPGIILGVFRGYDQRVDLAVKVKARNGGYAFFKHLHQGVLRSLGHAVQLIDEHDFAMGFLDFSGCVGAWILNAQLHGQDRIKIAHQVLGHHLWGALNADLKRCAPDTVIFFYFLFPGAVRARRF